MAFEAVKIKNTNNYQPIIKPSIKISIPVKMFNQLTKLPFKKRVLAILVEQSEPLDLSIPKISTRAKAQQRRHKIKESGRYTCETCFKSFVQQSSLITHKRIHTGERPYHCKVCDKRYGDLSTFTKHKRTHTGEKPYECDLCPARFSQSGNCLRHVRAVHGKVKSATSSKKSSPQPPPAALQDLDTKSCNTCI